jgi:hypothetical protein
MTTENPQAFLNFVREVIDGDFSLPELDEIGSTFNRMLLKKINISLYKTRSVRISVS